jgi:hypothetical protein
MARIYLYEEFIFGILFLTLFNKLPGQKIKFNDISFMQYLWCKIIQYSMLLSATVIGIKLNVRVKCLGSLSTCMLSLPFHVTLWKGTCILSMTMRSGTEIPNF